MRSPLSYLPLAAGMLVLVLSLALGVLTVTSRNSSQNLSTKAALETGSLSLSPSSGDYAFAADTSYPVGILVDSAGKSIDGVDVVINYDPTKVKIVEPTLATTSLFEQYPLNSVNNTKGEIRLGGATFADKPVTGIVATFHFQPLSKGEVNFTFSFIPGATTDSNIAEHTTAKDILGKVENGRYFFK